MYTDFVNDYSNMTESHNNSFKKAYKKVSNTTNDSACFVQSAFVTSESAKIDFNRNLFRDKNPGESCALRSKSDFDQLQARFQRGSISHAVSDVSDAKVSDSIGIRNIENPFYLHVVARRGETSR